MKWHLVGLLAAVLASSVVRVEAETSSSTSIQNSASEPMMLDISPWFWERYITADRTNMELISITGRQTFDGIPFQVDGRTHLYSFGLANARNKTRDAFPDMLGVKVGRTFDELHLLHATEWTDREQEVVAIVRFHYNDGTQHDFPIAYGAHIRDWQRMQTEEREIYTDPDTKVVWRGPGVPEYKSTTRISKTRLVNPVPRKLVSTIDFLSAGRVASYNLTAATVVNADPTRPVTAPVPLDRPERAFDTSLIVRVIGEDNQPLEGALVSPNASIAGSRNATVMTPLYTDVRGKGIVRYPKHDSSCFALFCFKAGWEQIWENPWVHLSTNNPARSEITLTLRMRRTSGELDAPSPSTDDNQIASSAKTGTNTATASGSQSIVSAKAKKPNTSTAIAAGNVASLPRFPVLIVEFPAGSRVRIEAANDLNSTTWEEVTLFESLPSSPFVFECGKDCAPQPQRYYRAVKLNP